MALPLRIFAGGTVVAPPAVRTAWGLRQALLVLCYASPSKRPLVASQVLYFVFFKVLPAFRLTLSFTLCSNGHFD